MKKLLALLVSAIAALALASCGGTNTITDPGGGGGAGATVASVQVIASSPQLQSDATGTTSVTITALVRDSGNVVIESLPVSFNTSSGSITVTQPTTDAGGQAVATVTNGQDPTNRAITVTATAGGVSGQVVINVVGSVLTVTGPTALVQGDSGSYTAVLKDSKGVGVANRTITISSATGNTLSAASLVTGANGDAQFTVTATTGGADTITVQGLGLTTTAPVTVSNDIFSILAPVTGDEISLAAVQNVQVQWTKAGAPQNGEIINFSSTRGTLSASTATTAAGIATVTISSTNAGTAVISATNDEGTSTSVTVEFVANRVASMDLQAVPFTVATGEQSELTAIARDATGNLVKNKLVVFELTDVTGGTLSVGSDITDSQGRAQSVYTGGSVPSASNGVQIRAFVDETAPPATIEDTVNITVAQKQVDISMGTGDKIFLPTTSLYAKEWAIIVTDTVGNPVANTALQMSLRSVRYRKGQMTADPVGTGSDIDWVPHYSTNDGVTPLGDACADEDVNVDGFLSAAEDDATLAGGFGNGNGHLEAGNRATVVGISANAADDACGTLNSFGSSVATVTTNGGGFARVCVIYPQSDNLWVDVELKGLLSVFGTEFTEARQFTLEALASDLDDDSSSPSGQYSPFGQANSCRNPD